MSRVLYISYDGMLEPLGQSQVLSYIFTLARSHDIHLISFEKAGHWRDQEKREHVRRRIAEFGVKWHPLRYHKRPSALATAWDIACGSLMALWLTCTKGITIVHARSYVASVMALPVKYLAGVRFVFDMRGFWADERVDGGIWPRDGRMYRVAKWFERRFLLAADDVVSLTHAGVREMRRFPYLQDRMPRFTVIPTCADLERFAPARADRKGLVLGYVGSAGTWYLFEQVAQTFRELLKLRPDARLRILNQNEHELIRTTLAAAGVPSEQVDLAAAEHRDIPAHLASMHAGIFFIKPVFSKQASAPTKLAEFLGCGIPCLSNKGVGDMAEVLEQERVGVALAAFDPETIRAGLADLLGLIEDPDTSTRCVAVARNNFSLEDGAEKYGRIYARLATEGTPGQ
jgi:glycosyltransferase involved in cell wall biosynthesis